MAGVVYFGSGDPTASYVDKRIGTARHVASTASDISRDGGAVRPPACHLSRQRRAQGAVRQRHVRQPAYRVIQEGAVKNRNARRENCECPAAPLHRYICSSTAEWRRAAEEYAAAPDPILRVQIQNAVSEPEYAAARAGRQIPPPNTARNQATSPHQQRPRPADQSRHCYKISAGRRAGGERRRAYTRCQPIPPHPSLFAACPPCRARPSHLHARKIAAQTPEMRMSHPPRYRQRRTKGRAEMG